VSLWAQPANIYKGQMGAGGVWGTTSSSCTGNVYISNGANFIGFCQPDPPPPTPRDPWDTTYVVTGDVKVEWVQGPLTGADTETITGGPFVVTITPVTVDYNVTVNPATLNYNDTVTVTATVSPSQVNGVNVPWGIDSITWAPAFGTQANPCAWNNWVTPNPGTTTCRRPFTRSGTLTVFATVQGTHTTNALTLTVTPPTLKVTGAPASIVGPQSVTFTPAVTPSTVAWTPYWYWTPDVGTAPRGIDTYCNAGEKPCTRTISASGWMKVSATIGEYALADSAHVTETPPQFKVTAVPQNFVGTQSVTFTATPTPAPAGWYVRWWVWTPDTGTSVIGCNWYDNPCTRPVSTSGSMKAMTVIGLDTLIASVHVSVVPCLTNDSILDDSRVRRKLALAWNNSNSNAAAAQRQEQWGMRVTLPGGRTVDTNFTNLPGATPCQSYDPARFRPDSIGQILLTWHTHPFAPAHQRPDSTWGQDDPAELLPNAACPEKNLLPGVTYASAPWPSYNPATGGGDRNSPWPQVIVDKVSSYWIKVPTSLTLPPERVTWRTVSRPSQCDILTYN
jgi:hypothetical protein